MAGARRYDLHYEVHMGPSTLPPTQHHVWGEGECEYDTTHSLRRHTQQTPLVVIVFMRMHSNAEEAALFDLFHYALTTRGVWQETKHTGPHFGLCYLTPKYAVPGCTSDGNCDVAASQSRAKARSAIRSAICGHC